jgi:hypothetical protein
LGPCAWLLPLLFCQAAYDPIASGTTKLTLDKSFLASLGGAIEALQLGAGQVFQKEFWLDLAAKDTSSEVPPSPSPASWGGSAPTRSGMSGAAVASDPKSRTISVSGATLTLDASTAQTFNEAFAAGKATFAPGEVFGTVGLGRWGSRQLFSLEAASKCPELDSNQRPTP